MRWALMGSLEHSNRELLALYICRNMITCVIHKRSQEVPGGPRGSLGRPRGVFGGSQGRPWGPRGARGGPRGLPGSPRGVPRGSLGSQELRPDVPGMFS